jgi:hypothetical protein
MGLYRRRRNAGGACRVNCGKQCAYLRLIEPLVDRQRLTHLRRLEWAFSPSDSLIGSLCPRISAA